MKNFTLFIFLLMQVFGFAQVPTAAAPTPPARVATDVISIYGSAYTNISGVNTNPGWGQSTVVTEVSIAGNNALQYANFNYQGTDWAGNAQNISAMEFLHVDVWTNDQKPNIYVISSGAEKPHAISTVTGSWQSLDIPVAGITGNLANIIQFKFDGGSGGTIYVDNLYFWKSPAAAGTPVIGALTVPSKYTGDAPFDLIDPTSDSPGAFSYTSSNTSVATISGRTVTIIGAGTSTITANQAASGSYLAGSVSATLVVTAKPTVAAPTPPNRNAGDVISLFSDVYANVPIDSWSATWDDSSYEDVQIAGDNTKKIAFTNFIGVDFSGPGNHLDASAMTNFHIDIWTATPTLDKSFNLKLSQWSGGTKEASFIEFSTTNASNPALPRTNPGTWISLDIPLTSWTSGLRDDIAQFIISSNLGEVYVDNIYFWKVAGTPVIGALSVPSKIVGDASFDLTDPTSDSPGAFSFTSSNISVATISGRKVTIIGAGTSTITANQAASGVYSAGSVKADLVVTAAMTSTLPTAAAPTPPARVATDVISIYGSAYTNISGVNTNPGWGQSTVVTEVSIAGNNALQYANFNYQGTDWAGNAQNISAMEFLHVDVWTNDQKPNIYVISSGAEKPHAISTVTGSWQSLDIPVAGITGNLANIIQFKFDGGSGGTIYVDNLYFWKSPAAAGTPVIGALTVPSKYTGDAPFDLIDPTSDSPGAFSYTSSNTSVATISGRTVTIIGAGTSTITANQAASGSYLAGSVSATLVVTAKPTVAAPTPPNRNAGDVISLFSDVYANVPIDSWSATWDDSSYEDVQIAGDNTKKIAFTNFIGVDFSGPGNHLDASAMTNFHIDIWTATPTLDKSFNLKLSQWSGGTKEASFIEFSTTNASNPALPRTNPGTWISLDIPLTSWTSGLRDDIAQFIISSNLGEVYVDNIYFYKGTSLGTVNFETSKVVMYPNPVTNYMTIEANSAIDKVSVYNILGQEVLVRSPKSNSTTIQTSELQKGVYIVKTTVDGKVTITKMIKD
jgi:hypothetical protein